MDSSPYEHVYVHNILVDKEILQIERVEMMETVNIIDKYYQKELSLKKKEDDRNSAGRGKRMVNIARYWTYWIVHES